VSRGISRVSVALATVVASVAALVAPTAASPSRASQRVVLSSLESGVLQRLNAIRAQHGLAPVRINARLTAASEQHSREMTAKGYFQHSSVDGTVFWKRIQNYYGPAGHRYWSVGENLLWSAPNVDPQRALELWMASPEHRKNILTPAWREIGVAAVHVARAPGTYNGLEVTVITTDFGVRR
jgi:uncharacterized protein YkwD